MLHVPRDSLFEGGAGLYLYESVVDSHAVDGKTGSSLDALHIDQHHLFASQTA